MSPFSRSKTVQRFRRIIRSRSERRIALISVTLVTLAVVLTIYNGKTSWRDNDAANDIQTESEYSSSHVFLQTGTADQLKTELFELENETPIQYPVRLENLNRRIALADKLSTKSLDNSTNDQVIESKLNALIEREFLLLDHLNTADFQTEELSDFADESLDSKNYAVLSTAHLAIAVSKLTSYLSKQNETTRRELTNAFRKAADESTRWRDAERLVQIILTVAESSAPNQATPLADYFVGRFASDDRRQDLLRVAEKYSSDQASDLVSLLEYRKSERSAIAANLIDVIESILARPNISENVKFRIFECASDFVRAGFIEHAKAICESIEIYRHRFSSNLLDKFLHLSQQMDRLNSIYSLNGLIDAKTEQPAKFKNDSSRIKLLFFVSPLAKDKSFQYSLEWLSALKKPIRKASVEFSFVYVYETKSKMSNHLVDVLDASKRLPRLNVWLCDTNTPSGTQAMSNMPLDEFPFVLVLNQENRITALNPTISVFSDTIANRNSSNRNATNRDATPNQ